MMNLGLMDPAFLGGLGGERDPYFSSVSLLLHGNGTNGSTTIIDSSPSPKTVTAVGNAQISTAQSLFGGASIALDGTGDLLRVASSSGLQIGTSDFTLELFAYLTGRGNGFGSYFDFRTASQNQVNLTLTFLGTLGGRTNATIKLFVNGDVSIVGGDVPLTTWTHTALCRASGSTRLFVGGEQFGSTYADNNNYVSDIVRIGGNVSEDSFINGYIDELRITKGIARYEVGTGANAGKMVHAGTNILALPTAPFPDA